MFEGPVDGSFYDSLAKGQVVLSVRREPSNLGVVGVCAGLRWSRHVLLAIRRNR